MESRVSQSQQGSPSALVMYHYFQPDDVVSAQLYAGLCKGLVDRGWQVTVMPCRWSSRDDKATYLKMEHWQGVAIRRIWRPRFRQASAVGRVLNSAWMLLAWSLAAFRQRPDVLIIGTDPIFSVLVALPWRLLQPRTQRFHWCFDLHPEAAIAEGMVSPKHPIIRLLRPVLGAAYRSCHRLGSIGHCMTSRLRQYAPVGDYGTYTPWALTEPPAPLPTHPDERRAIFGPAVLTLMYSGNFGIAHEAELILALARRLRDETRIQFAFSVRGNRADELRRLIVPEDSNVHLVDFAPQSHLEARLGCADIHMVSLRAGFEGTVVPSKFQGALAAGRPILYAGPEDSDVAMWIREYGLGWVLTPISLPTVTESLRQCLRTPEALAQLSAHCHEVYHQHYSSRTVIDHLDRDLRQLLQIREA